MSDAPTRYRLEIDPVDGFCPSGEKWAEEQAGRSAIPVLSCEGPCIRGDIARLAANIVSGSRPYARACYAEAALVPHSGMASWVRQAEQVVVIDGCFLHCMRRLMNPLVREGGMIHVDALPLHKRYSKLFLMDDVPEAERRETAQLTAEKILLLLQGQNGTRCSGACSCSE